MIAYAAARSTVATAIDSAVSGWTVLDHPGDNLDDRTIVVTSDQPRRQNASIWHQDLIVGIFTRRDSVAESFDLLDQILPTVDQAIRTVAVTVADPSPKTTVKNAGVEYIAQFIPLTIETTT